MPVACGRDTLGLLHYSPLQNRCRWLTGAAEKRIHGNHHNATESRVAQEAEAEAEDREQVVADTEHGTQGEAGGARGENGGNRALNREEGSRPLVAPVELEGLHTPESSLYHRSRWLTPP